MGPRDRHRHHRLPARLVLGGALPRPPLVCRARPLASAAPCLAGPARVTEAQTPPPATAPAAPPARPGPSAGAHAAPRTRPSARRKATAGRGAGTSGTAARPEPSAKVELSPAAALLSRAEADGTFDAQKVERLAEAIRDGSFQVDAEAIADKLLANAQELLGRTAQ